MLLQKWIPLKSGDLFYFDPTRKWRAEYIVNSFIDKRLSNGYTEGVNKKIKDIKRLGYGYKNFEFFRLRLLYILNQKVRGRK